MTKYSAPRRAIHLFTLLCAALLCLLPAGSSSAGGAQVDAVVIRNAALGEGASGNKNGALLWTGREDIKRHTELFLGNRQLPYHACGFNYDLELWSGSERVGVFPYNVECGEKYEKHSEAINALMQGYDRQFRDGTLYTLYYLTIPVERDPQALIQEMRRDGWHVFPVGGVHVRYPSLKLAFTLEGEDLDDEALEAAALTQARAFFENWPGDIPRPVLHTPPELRGRSSWGNRQSVVVVSRLSFPLGADMEGIAAALNGGNRSAGKIERPEYYRLSLISLEKDRKALKALLGNYPIRTIW